MSEPDAKVVHNWRLYLRSCICDIKAEDMRAVLRGTLTKTIKLSSTSMDDLKKFASNPSALFE